MLRGSDLAIQRWPHFFPAPAAYLLDPGTVCGSPEDSWLLKPGQPDFIREDGSPTPYVMPSLDPSAPVISTWEARSWRFDYPAPVDLPILSVVGQLEE